jgi:polyhydroxyalkanoate synthase
MNSCAVSPLWKTGSLPSNPNAPEIAERSANLQRHLAEVPTDAFVRAVQRAVADRHARLIDAIHRYRTHPYRRDVVDPPAIWRAGTTVLRDYGAVPEARDSAGPPILCVPSLINRAYVLDLKADTSLLRFLAARGWRPLLVDWDAPGAQERGFDVTAYVAGRLEAALNAACDCVGGAVPVLGYCMGGTLAIALAQRRPRDVAALTLLAAPWDFHAGQPEQGPLIGQTGRALEPLLQVYGELPVETIQMLFAGLDPHTAVRKFLAFGRMDPASARAEAFVALEDWLNDGVPLAGPVARTCLVEWYGANAPARGAWRVAGRAVEPREVRCPVLVLAPSGDRIVPPASAQAAGAVLPRAATHTPAIGHIGMVTSRRAPEAVWKPLADWLDGGLVRRT